MLLAGETLEGASVGTPVASPTSIPVKTTTVVTVTVGVADPALIPASVNLLQVDATGHSPRVLGLMHDDGKAGDGTAGDGIFTLQVSFTPTTPGTMYLQVSAAFKGALQRVLSGITAIAVGSGQSGLTISDFNPKTGPAGTLVNVTGSGFVPATGTVPQLTLFKQGGGTIAVTLSSFADNSISFVIPTGAATGPIRVSVASQDAVSASPLTITASSSFTLSAAPGTGELIQGQSVSFAVTLASNNAFNQLATLSVGGVPQGVSASFKPTRITAGQSSILTMSAPALQPIGQAILTLSASATVEGVPLSQSATAQLNVTAPTTSFIGRTVVDDSLQTPLSHVTVTMLGKDGNGGTTGCSGTTFSDAAGNFLLKNLVPSCVGPQLIGFDGTTAAAPPGKYAGVNIVYTLASGQVTPAPLLVHLPRIDDKETFLVQQNASVDQSYSYKSVPGLSVTVYKGTTFTMPDGSQPNPFPLAGIQVPIDRLPDVKPPVPTMVMVFIVAFQPANATASQPVAVYYPNTINTAPGVTMTLMTLDPTRGTMVPYGTATVSADGTQIVPDPNPAFPGKRYGIVHFDWHSPMPPPPPPAQDPQTNPPCTSCCGCGCSQCPDPTAGQPVQLSSGIDLYRKTDISFGGSRGTVSITRIYRTLSKNSGPFGIGGNHNYGYSLDSLTPQTAAMIDLITPDYNRFPFSRQPDGTLINTTSPAMLGAIMITSASGMVSLRWKDGSVYSFIPPGTTFPLLESVTDSNGNQISLTRNAARLAQITQITDPVGRSLTLTYDTQDRVISVTDPIGRTVSYTYNAQGALATVTDPEGGITKYDYLAPNLLMRETDPRNVVVTENSYDDASGRVTQQKQADGGIIKIDYTLANPLAPTSPVVKTVVTDPLGHQTTYRFSTASYLTDSVDPLGQSRVFERSGENLVTGAKQNGTCAGCGSPGAGDSTFTYDPARGNLLSQTDALGNKTQYTYESTFNKVATVTDPLLNVTSFSYDSLGNLTSRTDANNHTTQYKYDAYGELIEMTDPANQTTKFSYDGFGNLAMVTDARGNQTRYRYDAISRLVEVIDALGRRSSTTYDKLSRIVKQTDAKSVTTFQYDGVGNLQSLTDARGNKTSFTYDGMNRLLTRKTPLGTSDSRAYDFNGNLTDFTDRRGQKSSFGYDALNRLVTETYPDSTVARSYDANGRLVQVADSASGFFDFAYDPAGKLTRSTTPFGSVQYTYDQNSRIKSRQVVGQAAVQYVYDNVGNLMTASTAGSSVGRTYDPRDVVSTVSRANGVTSKYAYDELGRILSLTHSGSGAILGSLSYTYDVAGERVSQTSNVAQALTTPAVPSADYDVNNEQNHFGPTANTFDANGNLIGTNNSGGQTAYGWDSRSRLVSILAPGGQTTKFTYDFAGNLLQQVDAGPTLNQTQTFVLDSLTNVAFVNRNDGDQYSVLAGQSIDDHLAVIHANGNTEYGLADALNSTLATTDQAGAIKGRFSYEVFGQATVNNSSYPFQYTGRVPVSSELYYYRARFYNSQTGRFISEDPLGSGNRYRYAGNSPNNRVDPTGLLDARAFSQFGQGLLNFYGGIGALVFYGAISETGIGAVLGLPVAGYGLASAGLGLAQISGADVPDSVFPSPLSTTVIDAASKIFPELSFVDPLIYYGQLGIDALTLINSRHSGGSCPANGNSGFRGPYTGGGFQGPYISSGNGTASGFRPF
jgi:RHS repeat-associated protein